VAKYCEQTCAGTKSMTLNVVHEE